VVLRNRVLGQHVGGRGQQLGLHPPFVQDQGFLMVLMFDVNVGAKQMIHAMSVQVLQTVFHNAFQRAILYDASGQVQPGTPVPRKLAYAPYQNLKGGR
jgi:tryptophan synthase beta subunit